MVVIFSLLVVVAHVFYLVHAILGGYDISIEQAPYQVNYGDLCGGVLITDRWVLTSAHCGKEFSFIKIGSTYYLEGRRITIVSHLIHPRFRQNHEFDYDIQLLKLHTSLQFSTRVRPIAIRLKSYANQYGEDIFVSGWGHEVEKGNHSEVLQQVKLKIVPLEECQKIKQHVFNRTLTSRMFCAGGVGKDACQGDSGGGAINLGQLVGISAFGYGCGRNYPGVYTDVTHPDIRMWILGVTGV